MASFFAGGASGKWALGGAAGGVAVHQAYYHSRGNWGTGKRRKPIYSKTAEARAAGAGDAAAEAEAAVAPGVESAPAAAVPILIPSAVRYIKPPGDALASSYATFPRNNSGRGGGNDNGISVVGILGAGGQLAGSATRSHFRSNLSCLRPPCDLGYPMDVSRRCSS